MWQWLFEQGGGNCGGIDPMARRTKPHGFENNDRQVALLGGAFGGLLVVLIFLMSRGFTTYNPCSERVRKSLPREQNI